MCRRLPFGECGNEPLFLGRECSEFEIAPPPGRVAHARKEAVPRRNR